MSVFLFGKLSIDFRYFRVFIFCHGAYSKTRKPQKIFRSSFLEVLRLIASIGASIKCFQDTTRKVLLRVINEHLLLFTIILKVAFLVVKAKMVLR